MYTEKWSTVDVTIDKKLVFVYLVAGEMVWKKSRQKFTKNISLSFHLSQS